MSGIYSKDEELGKRDDDFRPRPASTVSTLFRPRWRKRRLLTLLGVVGALYLLLRNLPFTSETDDEYLDSSPVTSYWTSGRQAVEEPVGPPPRRVGISDDEEEKSKHWYNGVVKFYRLAESLHGIARTMGQRPMNRNVLFAASSLKSAANLFPMACEMSRWDRNYVHLAIMGRETLSMEDILQINGVDADCDIHIHDARSDYNEYSSDFRAEVAVGGALKHIQEFMHPQAIIMDDSAVENQFFTRAVRTRGQEYRKAVIEVPSGRYEDFLWLTRLDSGSLASWFRPQIDILVQAPQHSGSLIRLIKSLEQADYEGLRPPSLTLELPTDIEPAGRRFLENLYWPPGVENNPLGQNTLTLRHRIPSQHISAEQASLRFLESFYPRHGHDNHVLILSPQAELSPLYLHYLHYAVLEYRFSSYGAPKSDDLLGISLDVPSTLLNGSEGFTQPIVSDMNALKYTNNEKLDQTSSVPFLYQAPSSTGTLVFGDRWAELHDFLTHRIAASHLGKAKKGEKFVSESQPAWLEYLLELIRARGWFMLHPVESLMTVHNELATIPEEFNKEGRPNDKASEAAKQPGHSEEEAFLTADEPPVLTPHTEQRSFDLQTPLHEKLPFRGDLAELPHLPLLKYTGQMTSFTRAQEVRDEEYVPYFRKTLGGCEEGDQADRKRVLIPGKTDDLFCLPGMEPDYDTRDEDRAAAKAIADALDEAEGEDEEDEGEGEGKLDTEGEKKKTATVETKEELETKGQEAE
ncbi:hypothetical protein MBLNU230_g1719t1 [Neophaeotheca triangularis]